MKKYKVTKEYIIEARDEAHLRVILFNAALFPIRSIEQQCVREHYKEVVPRVPKKQRRNPWVALFTRQLKYLVTGH